MIRTHKRQTISNIDECVADLFEAIYKSTSKPANISDSGLIGLLAPLVKAAIETKNEPVIQRLDEVIQAQGEAFIDKLKRERIEDELEFQKFRRRFAIRSILHNYYECEQTDMTLRKLYNHLHPQMQGTSVDFTTDRLKIWLNRLGFCIVTVPHNREIVIEMHSQKLARLKYIRRIQSLRQADRNIVYFREVTISIKPKTAQATPDELTVFFAANHTGLLNFAFVENDSRTTENFIEWLTIIAGQQPKNTVLVIEPKPFSAPQKPSIFGSAIPTSFKYERIWKNFNTFIPGANSNSDTVYSVEMLDFCWQNREAGIIVKKSFVDPTKAMMDAGFEVVHLPCMHTELCPMHRIDFPKLIEFIPEKDRTIEKIKATIRSHLDSSTAAEWKEYLENAIRIESDFLRFEALLSDEDEAIEMDDSSDDVQIVDENRETVTLSDDDDDDD